MVALPKISTTQERKKGRKRELADEGKKRFMPYLSISETRSMNRKEKGNFITKGIDCSRVDGSHKK